MCRDNLIRVFRLLTLMLAGSIVPLLPAEAAAQEDLPVYLRDRGTCVPLSQFGTYIRKGELIVYPFYEYYNDNNLEYEPGEFGFELFQEFTLSNTSNGYRA